MEEIWRDVPGSNGKYQISLSTKEGKCRSLGYKGSNKIKELTTRLSGDGRIFWGLMINGKRVCHQAARWIAITYPELVQNEYFEGAEIEHIIPLSVGGTNHPTNLRWVTHKQNQNNKYSVERNRLSHIGKKASPKSIQKRSSSLRNRPDQSKVVLHYNSCGVLIGRYLSISEASRDTKLSKAAISFFCNKKRKTKNGDIWKYEKEV